MKKYLIIFVFLSMTLYSSCNRKPTPSDDISDKPAYEESTDGENIDSVSMDGESIAPGTSYSYDEHEFQLRYESALAEYNLGTLPRETAPTNQESTGFAVISLGEEIYGVHAFAILPISKRELTNDEMLQLAAGMGGISFEQLMDPSYSWNGLGGGWKGSNRYYYWDERFSDYKLDALYRYDGLRPSQQLSNQVEDAGPVYIPIGGNRYWFYPLQAMSEEQLLQIIDVEFSRVSVEDFRPLENEIQYSDAREVAKGFALEYGISENAPTEYYHFYWSTRNDKNDQFFDISYWSVGLHFTDGFDYLVKFDAEDGSFMEWKRYPAGYFSEKEPDDFKEILTGNSSDTYSNEDLIKVAETFTSQYLLKDGASISESYVNYMGLEKQIYNNSFRKPMVIMEKGKIVSVFLSTQDVYEISILCDDLSVQSLKKVGSGTGY